MSLRILHCLRAPVGGLFRHVRDLATAQAKRGYAVGVLCDDIAKDGLTEARLRDLETRLELGLHRVAMPRSIGAGDIFATRRTQALCQALQIDVAHGHGAKGGAYARLAAQHGKRRGANLSGFYTPHGGSLHYATSSLKGKAFMAAERRLAQATDGIIFESAFSQQRYGEKVGSCCAPSRVIPNGVGEADFIEVAPADDATDLLFIGELRNLKGVDVLLTAHAALAATRPLTLTIVGDGPDGNAFRELAASLGHQALVNFAGALPAREAFTRGRNLVVPSRAESLPYIVLEAAAGRVPLVASNVGGIPEIVDGTDVPLVPADDPEALSQAIVALLDNRERALSRADALRDVVSQRFTVESMTDAVNAFYNDVRVTAAA